jgi:hypothetical protein
LNGSKQTALHLATLAGCVPAVRMLVEHGAQILFTAAEAKSKKVRHFAVSVVNLTHSPHTPADVPVVFVSGQVPASALHLAAANRSEAIVSLFVELGLDINLTDAAGRIPLHFAARAMPKNAGFIEFLLARGANAKAVDEEGQGVLHYAITVHTPLDHLDPCDTQHTHTTRTTRTTRTHDTHTRTTHPAHTATRRGGGLKFVMIQSECSAELVAMCKKLLDAGADAHSKDPVLVRPNAAFSNAVFLFVYLFIIKYTFFFVDARFLVCVQGLARLTARSYYRASDGRDLVNLFVERGVDITDPRTTWPLSPPSVFLSAMLMVSPSSHHRSLCRNR